MPPGWGRLLGDFQGTPTIRLFSPKRKPKKTGDVTEKLITDYKHGERTATDLRRFLEDKMPNYSERVKFGREDYDRLSNKAKRFGLPLVVVFTTKAKTPTTIKWLSAEFRRRILLVEVPPTDKNEGLRKEIFGSNENTENASEEEAALYVVTLDGGIVPCEGDKFTRRNLQDFLEQHALKKRVLAAKEPTDEPPKPKHDEF
jgi:hypothetical protein